MPGLVPGIHCFLSWYIETRKTWMVGTSPAMTNTWVKSSGNDSRQSRQHALGDALRRDDRISIKGTRKMSIWARVSLLARALWTVLEAAEAGPHGRMEDQIVALNRRVTRLEQERASTSE
jgi:hypothetical protein